eukprot:PhF_6_TR27380/c0_g1_i1/m.40289
MTTAREAAIQSGLYCDDGDFIRARELEFQTTTTLQSRILRKLQDNILSTENSVPAQCLWHKASTTSINPTNPKSELFEFPCCLQELKNEETHFIELVREHKTIETSETMLFLLADVRSNGASRVISNTLESCGCTVIHSDASLSDEVLLEIYLKYRCTGVVASTSRLCQFMYHLHFVKFSATLNLLVCVGFMRGNQRRFLKGVRKSQPPKISQVYGNVITGMFATSNVEDTALHYNPSWMSIQYLPTQPDDCSARDTVRHLYTYEHQRHYQFIGWSSQLLPGDRNTWSLEDGTPMRRDSVVIPFGWTVSGEWTPDPDGWQYCENKFDGPWDLVETSESKVRRRKWLLRVEVIRFDATDTTQVRKMSVTSSLRSKLPVYQLELKEFGEPASDSAFTLSCEMPVPFRFCGLKFLTDEFSEVYSRFLDYQIRVGPVKIVFYVVTDPLVIGCDAIPDDMRRAANEIICARIGKGKDDGVIPEDYLVDEEELASVYVVPYCDFVWDPVDYVLPRVILEK